MKWIELDGKGLPHKGAEVKNARPPMDNACTPTALRPPSGAQGVRRTIVMYYAMSTVC